MENFDINYFISIAEELNNLENSDSILLELKFAMKNDKIILWKKTKDEQNALKEWINILENFTSDKDVEILYEKICNCKDMKDINIKEYNLEYERVYKIIYPTVRRKIEEEEGLTVEQVVKKWLFEKHNFLKRGIITDSLFKINIKLLLEKRIFS